MRRTGRKERKMIVEVDIDDILDGAPMDEVLDY